MAPHLPLLTQSRDSTYHKMKIKRLQVKYRHNFTCIYGFISRLNECKFSIRIRFLKLGLIRCIIVYGLNQLSSVKLSNHRAILFDFFWIIFWNSERPISLNFNIRYSFFIYRLFRHTNINVENEWRNDYTSFIFVIYYSQVTYFSLDFSWVYQSGN